MELPQSRPFGTAQGTKATHDFLSLYSHSSVQQDPRPSAASAHGGFLKTHNFLQPVEGEEKNAPKEGNLIDINMEKPPPTAPPGIVEHVLPGGIGTYSISHISYFNPRVPKPEENVFTVAPIGGNDRNDNNSACSSFSGSGFTMWDESTRKGNSGKENRGDVNVVKEPAVRAGQWPLDRPSQSSSNYRSSVSPLSSSQALGQKSQSFMDMIKSAKGPNSIEDEDEEDVTLKKEISSSQKGGLRVKVDGKSSDQKANTPRSKHSATEQRRRCKINDRFQMLRELIPHSDQKRDKASFLLEVIEYIQFLQEKVNRYEGPYPGWNGEPAKVGQWKNGHGPAESLVDPSRVVNGVAAPVLMFGAKVDEKPTIVPISMTRNPHILAEPKVPNAINFKTVDQQSGMNNGVSVSSVPHLDVYASMRNGCTVMQPPSMIPSDVETASHPQLQLWQSTTSTSEPVAGDKVKDQEPALEGGTISISSIYSQGLLSTLTRALQSSGVDLSQASISVQVDIGKRANNKQNTQVPREKVGEFPSDNQSLSRPRSENTSSESDQAAKRFKTS